MNSYSLSFNIADRARTSVRPLVFGVGYGSVVVVGLRGGRLCVTIDWRTVEGRLAGFHRQRVQRVKTSVS